MTSTKSRAEHQTAKFGVTYNDAMKEAMTVAARAARRHHKWVSCASDKDDLLAAAYEGILLAWRAWRGPEVSAWSYTAWIYAELYARREANRRKSVVSTGSGSYNQHTGRQAVRDDSLLQQNEDGAWVDADLKDARPLPAQQVEMMETLRVIGIALREAIPACAGEQVALANDVITQRILIDVAQSAASIASKHKVTSATVYKIETALRGALAATL
jgi:hypothetical protein